jgi:hypothetical protein
MKLEPRGSWINMPNPIRCVTPAAVVAGLCLALALAGLPARADQVVQTPQAPVVVIRSASGLVTVVRGDPGAVRVVGAGVTATNFVVSHENQGVMVLPGSGGLPTRRFTVPGVREGTAGVRIDNPGGDITVYVPPRVSAMLLRADSGDANVSGFRGPYVVDAEGGNVDLQKLWGFGHVRTTSGHVNMNGVGGNLHVETTFGTVSGVGMSPERAEIKTQDGDVEWSFARLGSGPYRFMSNGGNVHVALIPSAAANIDAQSTRGSVVNRFNRRAANVRFMSAHAMSISLGGGGPQITAASQSGTVVIGPRNRPPH